MQRLSNFPLRFGPHKLNDGWLRVERSMYDRIERYDIEEYCAFPGGWLELRRFGWLQPIDSVWSTEDRCYLISIALTGEETASVVTNLTTGQRVELNSTGNIHLVPPGQTMQCKSKKGQLRSLRCVLHANLVESFLDTNPMWDWRRVPLHQQTHLRGGQIEWLLRRMYRELRAPDFATGAVIESLAKQLAAEILRRFHPYGTNRAQFAGGLSALHKRVIRERLSAPRPLPSREELADLCDMTARHLSRAFRTEMGQTLGTYIDCVMVERARSLLISGASVQDIADSIGYATPSSFTSAFRRATGLLPREVAAVNKSCGVGRHS